MVNCPFCSLKIGEKKIGSSFAPTLCWMETSRTEQGFIQIEFGYGDDPHDHLLYIPQFCPECGRKNKKIMDGGEK